ncbi:hypothetical protein E9531_00080 [Lampropedia puyangensis]|uniref:Uncharacterized protein n=1 Tax=Lampropedia puyangensis TaxID=1330072 RepID=A0A4V4GSC2_9BURK|nr:hypothetical protein [Lampropedia puyangensis]THU04996.1 hypothetical protein E9531_00080 [Lampropedia puyangensis]
MADRHSDSDTAPVAVAAGRRWLRRVLWLLLALVLLVVVAFGALLAWASSADSLPRTLQLAQKYLPQEQSLLYAGAQGSITGGGGSRATAMVNARCGR